MYSEKKLKLLECPFCGGETISMAKERTVATVMHAVKCLSCFARGPLYIDKYCAVDAWQKRGKRRANIMTQEEWDRGLCKGVSDAGEPELVEIRGCENHKLAPQVNKGRGGEWAAYCNEPYCEITLAHKSREEAVEAWNKGEVVSE